MATKKPDPDTLGPVNMGSGESGSPTLGIPKLRTERLLIPIVSTSPLICHNWSEKARRQIRDKKQNRRVVKEATNIEAEYEASMYRIHKDSGEAGYGMPVGAFAKCTVGAARFYGKDVTMTGLRQFLRFGGVITDADPQPVVEIFGSPKMREDHVRLSGGSADLTYRAEFPEWTAVLDVQFVATSIDSESVLSLIDAGGSYVGIGDWRPERGGLYGCFAIDEDHETKHIK